MLFIWQDFSKGFFQVSTPVSFMGWFNLKVQVVDWSFKLTDFKWVKRTRKDTFFFFWGGLSRAIYERFLRSKDHQKSKLRSTRSSELPIFVKKNKQRTTRIRKNKFCAKKLFRSLFSWKKTRFPKCPNRKFTAFASLRGQCYLFSWQHLVSKWSRD